MHGNYGYEAQENMDVDYRDSALAGVVVFPVGGGMGVGVNAILSKALGEKDFGSVNKAAMNGIFLSLINYIIFVIVGVYPKVFPLFDKIGKKNA